MLCSGSVNTFPRKREVHNNTVTMETGVFSVGYALRLYSEDPRPAENAEIGGKPPVVKQLLWSSLRPFK
jgi:hypothetical protein